MAAQWTDEEAPTHRMVSVRGVDDRIEQSVEPLDSKHRHTVGAHEAWIAELERRLAPDEPR